MTQYFPKLRPGEMKQEFAGAELGDARLHERLGEIVEALAKSPESSFAAMCDTEAEREGHEAEHRFVTRLVPDRRAKAVHPDADIVHIRQLFTDAKDIQTDSQSSCQQESWKNEYRTLPKRARHAMHALRSWHFRSDR